MSVRVDYVGRFGNNVFQYVYARLFAEKNGLALETPWNYQDVLPIEPSKPGLSVTEPKVRFDENDRPLEAPRSPGAYVFYGFFQDAGIYYANRERILAFTRPHAVEAAPPSALVCHVRLEDYYSYRIVIHPSWYRDILSRERFDQLYVVAQQRDTQYLKAAFGHLKYTLLSGGSLAEDWNYLRRFERVVCSNSTMAWWAVFLGRATKVYTFERWIENPSVKLSRFPGATPVPGPFLHEAP